ncbi:hypothetical protein QYM36_002548 [Artemia franciscana]|uniref:Uncharacterized protein n=1 Tax=Artemia franciscana TaxID=6661 RepID=A0AA88LHM6_ARTSF|nr:hypothetical protein QYM36_002548 [Artemia franciscana]
MKRQYLSIQSILALSEIFSALSEIARTKEVTTAELVAQDLAQRSTEVTITLSTGEFLSGLGSDITKQALCYLIRRCCEANLCPTDGNRIDFRCGYALALCEIPLEVMEISAKKIIEALTKCTEIMNDTEKWINTRQYSLRALSTFCISYFEKIENYKKVASEVL